MFRTETARPLPESATLLGSLIDGEWFPQGKEFEVRDKFHGHLLAKMPEASRETVERAVRTTLAAFEAGAPKPLERKQILLRVADLVGKNRSQFVHSIVAEAGFTTIDASTEVDRTIVTFTLAAEEATRLVGETVSFENSANQSGRLGFTLRMPLGVVCAITPFNSPLNTVAHKVAPALAAGNTVILKPAGQTPLTAALLCKTILEAGYPPAHLALVQGQGRVVGEWLLQEQAISFYSFTGSTEVGRLIQSGAGLRRTQLELGSIASAIVCKDADLDRAVPKIVNAGFRKAGQVCTSIQRLYVERACVDDVSERLRSKVVALQVGDPHMPKTEVGPMISEAAAERAHSWIRNAAAKQARVICGGSRSGPTLSPTILTNVSDGMEVVDREIFAPVMSILPFDRLDDAVKHANNTPFGLAAGLFTRDINQALHFARKLRFGSIHINETSSARADGMPFGGVKESGHGQEGPSYAMRELTEERLVTFNV
ncbi:MAG: aldehyde dehydrogenase family protein [Mesorhizobium sp.]|nr:MAG: aldehyde dehydrogenase family protein [Mesorhizobium sp.]